MSERSFLFVPADRPDRFSKALSSSADVVVFDLEDAVLPSAKSMARDLVADWLSANEHKRVGVRINANSTDWYHDDLKMISAHADLAAVMIPKLQSKDDIASVRSGSGGQIPIIGLVETTKGYLNLRALSTSDGLVRLAFGSVDFCTETGIRNYDTVLDPVRLEFSIVSSFAGLAPPLDGVTLAISDHKQLLRDVNQARLLGFGGKLCIHPSQVQIVNEYFLPSREEIEWAKRVIEASRNSAVTTVDGKLVDHPIVLQATRLLQLATDR